MKMPSFDAEPDEDKVYSGFGKSMLHRMGWKEGEGIGKNKQGMAEALKVKKRNGEVGLGAEEALRYKWEDQWWEGHFKSAADKFADAVAAAVGSDGSDSDGDSDSEDDSEMARQLASCAVDANGNSVVATGKVKGRDGIYYSGKKSDFSLAQDLAKDGWGNWGRAKGKLARIAKMEEEQLAKYGIQAGGSAARAVKNAANDDGGAVGTMGTGSESDSGDGGGEEMRGGKSGKSVDAAAAAAAAPLTPSPEPEPEIQLTGEAYEGAPSQSTRDGTWWLNAKFQWGGLVGSARERSAGVRKVSNKRRGRRHDDPRVRVWGVGDWVMDPGFRVQGLGFRVQGLGLWVQGLGFRA